MVAESRLVYWDVGCFLRYVQRDQKTIGSLAALLEESASRDSDLRIVTSVLSITQVAYLDAEKATQVLDEEVERRIEYLWQDRQAVTFTEFHELVAREARDLVRHAIGQGWNAKPEDMIHLASAKRNEVSQFHTFDGGLAKWSVVIGVPLSEPTALQPKLLPD